MPTLRATPAGVNAREAVIHSKQWPEVSFGPLWLQDVFCLADYVK